MHNAVFTAAAFAALLAIDVAVAQQAGREPNSPQQTIASPLVGLPIYSSDGEEVGRVASVDAGADGSVKGVKAEIEGFLGLGTGMVGILAGQFRQEPDRLVLTQTADQVRGLPGAAHESFDGGGSGARPPAAP